MNHTQSDVLRRIIWQKYKVDGYSLFYETPEKKRNEIIAEAFETMTKYRLVPGKGLVSNYGRGKDCFPGYKSFDHLKSLEALSFDITQTIKASRDRKAVKRRKVFLEKKQAWEKKQQEKIEKLNRKEHLMKWEPESEETKRRLEQLKLIRNIEQERKFER